MSAVACYRCGLGSIPDVQSALVRRALERPGFRSQLVYVHQNQGVCGVVQRQRELAQARYDKQYRSLRARIVRLARRATAIWH